MLDTLAAAYAEGGRFDAALETLARALELARAKGHSEMVDKLRRRRQRYESHQPFRALESN